MKQRLTHLLIPFLLMAAGARAQALWTSAELKARLAEGFSVYTEGEYRTTDGLDGTARWGLTAGADYKFTTWLKGSAGYSYLERYFEARTTKKGNVVSSYHRPRHRIFASLAGEYSVGRLTISLRERWQYTYSPERSVAKWDGDDGSAKADEIIAGKGENMLRSRLKADYDIRHSPFTPFVSWELYHSLSGFSYEKTRWTAGTDIRLSKRHALTAFWRYIDRRSDDDGAGGHIIGLGYQFKLK